MEKSPITSMVGKPGGIAPLDGSSKVPLANVDKVLSATNVKGVSQAAATVLREVSLSDMVDKLGGAASVGTGGLTRASAVVIGSNGQIPFNDAGTMAGDAGLTWDKTNNRLNVNASSSTANLTVKANDGSRAFVVEDSDGVRIVNVEDSDVYYIIELGSVGVGTPCLRLISEENKFVLQTTGLVQLGDFDGAGNSTAFEVNDADQKVNSSVKIVVAGDVIVDDSSKGMVLKSPNGHYWRGTIDNAGALSWADLGTTLP